MASSWLGIVHHLSGPMDLAITQNPVHRTLALVSSAGHQVTIQGIAFTTPCGLEVTIRQNASSIDSSVRVSRRAESGTSHKPKLCFAHRFHATSGKLACTTGTTNQSDAATMEQPASEPSPLHSHWHVLRHTRVTNTVHPSAEPQSFTPLGVWVALLLPCWILL